MNDFFEWFVPCFMTLSIFAIIIGYVIFLRVMHYKEKAVLSEYGLLLPHTKSRKSRMSPDSHKSTSLAKWVIPQPKNKQPGYPKTTNDVIQKQIDKALDYKTQIDRIVRQTSNHEAGTRLGELAKQVDDWVEAIKDLAHRVEYFQNDPLIQKDLAAVPRTIQTLETRLANEAEEPNRNELERTLQNLQKQRASLEQLGNMVKRAEIQIESTLSALGTIYSQVLTQQSTNHIADYSQLSANVNEEVHRLQDQLEALQEIRLGVI